MPRMRLVSSLTSLSLLLSFSASAFAQNRPPVNPIQHIIIVVEENRSPDNLFGADAALIQAGANLWPAANNPGYTVSCLKTSTNQEIQVHPIPIPLDTCVGPLHGHTDAWVPIFDNGANDGLCNVKPDLPKGCVFPGQYPQYSYVPNTIQANGSGLLDPYFQLANSYGFANYMFQTNQGASFAAHQFLFSGTSAPDYYNDPNGYTCGLIFPCWEWFVSDNPIASGDFTQSTGCISNAPGEYVASIDPASDAPSAVYTPPLQGAYPGYPCYDHPSMQDELAKGNVSWKYYSGSSAGLWNAPGSLYRVCQPSGIGGTCTWPGWNSTIIAPASRADDQAQILNDIESDPTCTQLASVSWVMPDGRWSDHSAVAGDDGGPSWAAALVNAIGNENPCHYWASTIIIFTWDDWGGWYDHINPAEAMGGPGVGYKSASSASAGAQYVYGFRVPLLVVSAYTPEGYISGGNTSGPSCPGPYCHDFGSILGFVEHEFKLPLGGIGPKEFPYADYYAPDGPFTACGPVACPYPLADFFTLTKPRAFHPVTGAKYPETCFHYPNQKGCFTDKVFRPPDNDDDED